MQAKDFKYKAHRKSYTELNEVYFWTITAGVKAVVGEDTGPRERILVKQTNHGDRISNCLQLKALRTMIIYL